MKGQYNGEHRTCVEGPHQRIQCLALQFPKRTKKHINNSYLASVSVSVTVHSNGV